MFDLDDTLFDHRRSARAAADALRDADAALSAIPVLEIDRVNGLFLEEIHERVLTGAIDVDQAREERMARLLAHFGQSPSPARVSRMARIYRVAYQSLRATVPGARELLQELRRRGVRLAVVTNNVTHEQEEKMRALRLAPLVDKLIVSEAVGAWKPDPKIFRVALEGVGSRPEHAVMVGDSWSSDVVGATASGVHAVWYNPLRIDPPDSSLIACQIHALEPAEEIADRILAVVGPLLATG